MILIPRDLRGEEHFFLTALVKILKKALIELLWVTCSSLYKMM